jgi:hypothetical protein
MDQDLSSDPFAIDISGDERLRELYLKNEKYDGYVRDQNVLGDGITIEDSMSLLVRYRTGAVLAYSLNAYLPREGFRIAFNGTKGRLEYEEEHSPNIVAGSDQSQGDDTSWRPRLVVYPMFGKAHEVDVPTGEGGHGGGDVLLQHQLFTPNSKRDAMGRDAGHEQGAASVLVGIAANRSFESGEAISIGDLCPALGDARRLSELT